MNAEATTHGVFIMIRKPKKEDGKAIFELMRSCAPPLDLNSMYLYFLVGAHFSKTSAVVEQNGAIIGFTFAYLLPDGKDRLFVWQIAVHPQERFKGMGRSMLDEILLRPVCRNVNYLETTVTASNEASKHLFKSLAKRCRTLCREETFLESESFGEMTHEEEILYTIGPFHQ